MEWLAVLIFGVPIAYTVYLLGVMDVLSWRDEYSCTRRHRHTHPGMEPKPPEITEPDPNLWPYGRAKRDDFP